MRSTFCGLLHGLIQKLEVEREIESDIKEIEKNIKEIEKDIEEIENDHNKLEQNPVENHPVNVLITGHSLGGSVLCTLIKG